MKNTYNIRIPPTNLEKDLTIIYKRGTNEFHELKASKIEFFRTLRYFNQKPDHNKQTDLIYIQENIPFDIFEKFIDTLTNKEIEINEENVPQFYYLCKKYEYDEFLEKIEEIIKENPSLLSSTETNCCSDGFDEAKIAKNLDMSIQNGFLNTLPLKKLIKILKSPNMKINDHHLLFSLITQTIDKYSSEKLNENDRQILMILPTFLDFRKMTNDEIEELFDKEKNGLFFNPQNSKEEIQNFISNEKELKKKIEQLEQKFNEFERKFQIQIENLEEEIQQKHPQKETKNEIQKVDDELLYEQAKYDEENTKLAINQLQQLFKAQDQIFHQNEEEEEEEKNDEEENFKIKSFEFNENNELNGIFRYLSIENGGNPHDNGTIEVTSNSICSPFCHPKNLLNSNQEDDYLPKSSELNAWVTFDFKNMEIEISKYSIKSSNFGQDYGHLKNWVIEISNNGKNWKKIDEHSDYQDLNGPNIIKTFDVKQNGFSRYCRFRNTGEYWGIKEKWGIQFNSIEFYGRLKIND